MKQVLLITFYQVWKTQKKERPTLRRAVNQFISL